MRLHRKCVDLARDDGPIREILASAYAVRETLLRMPHGAGHTAPWLAIGRVLRGRAVAGDGARYHPGCLFVIPTGGELDRHIEPPGIEDEYVVVKGATVSRFERQLLPLTDGARVTIARPPPPILAAHRELVACGLSDDPERPWRFLARLFRLFEQLRTLVPTTNKDLLADRVRDLIASQPDTPWTAQRIADNLHVSHSTLTHRFREQADEPVMRYVRRQRVRRAGELLECGHAVSVVADLMGFSSPYQLSRVFRAITGSSPTAWRKSQEERTAAEPVV